MEDATTRVCSFVAEQQLAIRVTIEHNAGGFFQYFMKKSRTFISQNSSRSRIAGARTCCKDVRAQKLGAVIHSAADDATLGITGIRFVRVGGASVREWAVRGRRVLRIGMRRAVSELRHRHLRCGRGR